jgi:uncharacterized protein
MRFLNERQIYMDNMRVWVAYATPEKQVERKVSVPRHANVAIAIRLSAICDEFPELKVEQLSVGIHRKKVTLDSSLREGDRVEIYRPLLITPMEARRLRAKKKGKKTK